MPSEIFKSCFLLQILSSYKKLCVWLSYFYNNLAFDVRFLIIGHRRFINLILLSKIVSFIVIFLHHKQNPGCLLCFNNLAFYVRFLLTGHRRFINLAFHYKSYPIVIFLHHKNRIIINLLVTCYQIIRYPVEA